MNEALRGLSAAEIDQSRAVHGANTLTEKKRRGFLRQFVGNLGDPIIRILIGALVINVIFMFGDINWFETGGIAAAIMMATLVSTISEYGSERAFQRLSEESLREMCRVMRDGQTQSVKATDLVVGDIVLLGAGEKLPADGVLLSGEVMVDQSSLNGESAEVRKHVCRTLPDDVSWELSHPGLLFRGSILCSGEGVMRVGRVGDKTLYGSVADGLQDEGRPSPLKHRLSVLARSISFLGYVAAAMIAFAYLFNVFAIDAGMNRAVMLSRLSDWRYVFSELLNALTLAVTVIVVAVPEGLPMMITVVLSSNMKRMMRDNVLVRKLVGIETAGSLNILFTDKTGTLTEGRLRVHTVIAGDGSAFSSLRELKQSESLCRLFALSCLYNTSGALTRAGVVGGNATERALLEYIAPYRLKQKPVVERRIPFDSAKKYSAATLGGAEPMVLIKGAPELILPRVRRCYSPNGTVIPCSRHLLEQRWNASTRAAERVLAVATSRGGIDDELILIGLVAIRDGLRREAKQAVREMKQAGVQVVMITGDNKNTAAAISAECGILDAETEVVLDGGELARLSDSEVTAILPRLAVVSRALPTDKSRLVRLSQAAGLVAGMTGDGVNDAPALKSADVGFAMGSGTDIAREAGDIVILDNNFFSITKAVLYGRTIFENIRKFIVFQLTMNLCAVALSLICPFIGVESPVTVIQMLWVNIIMDTLGALAFAGEVPLREYMREMPKSREERILNRQMIHQIVLTGLYTVTLCIAFLKAECFRNMLESSSDLYHMTAFFALFIFTGIFNCFNARTRRTNLTAHLAGNRMFLIIMMLIATVQLVLIYHGGELFRTTPLSWHDVATVILLAMTVIPFDLIRKLLLRRKHAPAKSPAYRGRREHAS